MRDATIAKRSPASAVANDKSVFGSSDLFVLEGDRLHQLHGINVLLVAHAPEVVKRQPREGHRRRSVHRRIIETVH
jgi:hypothetical protein